MSSVSATAPVFQSLGRRSAYLDRKKAAAKAAAPARREITKPKPKTKKQPAAAAAE